MLLQLNRECLLPCCTPWYIFVENFDIRDPGSPSGTDCGDRRVGQSRSEISGSLWPSARHKAICSAGAKTSSWPLYILYCKGGTKSTCFKFLLWIILIIWYNTIRKIYIWFTMESPAFFFTIFLWCLLISITGYSVYVGFGPPSKQLRDPFEEHED